MKTQWLLKRNLNTFGLSLEWNGHVVFVKNGKTIIDLRDAPSLATATEEMTKLENTFMAICGAMC
jgi:hypothetical protein